MSFTVSDLCLCFVIGYLFGNILPADLIGRWKKKSPFEHGSGNPGMTNTIKTMGKAAGAAVLAGDILKTVAAVLVCRALFPACAPVVPLYAGFGAMLGHCYPFWHHFQGGKGVAVVCSAYILYAPWMGIAALACGGLMLLLKKGVKAAAAVIPAVYLVLLLFRFSWISYLPALGMGIWMAFLNLRPNRLAEPAAPASEASASRASEPALPAPSILPSLSSASSAAEALERVQSE